MRTRIVGGTHNNPDTGENRQYIIADLIGCDLLYPGKFLQLRREPDNPYDANSIAVIGPDSRMLGYICREIASEYAPLLDNGKRVRAVVTQILGNGQDLFYGIEINIFEAPMIYTIPSISIECHD